MHFMLMIVCAFTVQVLFAQIPATPLPGAYSKSFSQVFAQFGNTAALADVHRFSAGLTAERRFLLKEIGVYSMALGVPLRGSSGVLGLGIRQQGYVLFREQLIGLAYALPLGNRLNAGLRMDYRRTLMPGYGSSGLLAEIGVIGKLTDQCRIGLQLFHPSGRGDPPAVYLAGLGYEPSPQFLLEAEWRKEAAMPLSSRVSIVYRPVAVFWAMGGFVTQPAAQFAGIGYCIGDLKVSMSGSYHPLLGITPSMMVIWGKD